MPAPHEPSPQPAQAPQHQSPLQRGNAALRAGDPAAAIRHYALGLLDEAQHRNGPIAAQLAANLVRASKPRMPNILLGLLYRLLWDARVLVDIDDDELAFVGGQPLLRDGASAGAGAGSPAEHALAHWLQRYNGLPPGDDLPGRPWTELGMSLATAFDGLSVVNRALQQRHGGVIIRHARDPRQFQPAAAPRATALARLRSAHPISADAA
ncbi:hypothetical protein [Thiorhodovibrio frisius]|uniref:hypothetical protein n=1 Tax=Thiorhodovibrio frisius TaxID=631362 RepID=UPI00022C6D05|nr:hypothetical protein [Thiorhodovibrio frisius]WPL20103.1 hypothetical protein Thiofri_00159 [Thiorhodovibrio frisius]